MEYVFAAIGICSVITICCFVLLKLFDRKQDASHFIVDNKVYDAAKLFEQGNSKTVEVKNKNQKITIYTMNDRNLIKIFRKNMKLEN